MKLKVQHVMDAILTISRIIREQRPLPQKGAYRLARMHAKLLPEFQTINGRRDAMITAYNHHEMIDGKDNAGLPTLTENPEFSVPVDKMSEFTAAWAEIGAEEIEVEVEPIPLSYLDLGPSIECAIRADELIVLGDLVKE